MNNIFKVEGMSCVICKNTVEKTLNNMNGVNEARVNLLENEVYIDYNDDITFEMLEKVIKDAGYTLLKKKKENKKPLIKLIISIILSITSMLLMHHSPLLQLIIVATIYILNINILTSGIRSLIKLNPNMNSLVSISSLTALIYSLINVYIFNNEKVFFETSVMILTIVSIGKYIEQGTKSKATSILRGLSTLIPMQANLKKDDGQIEIIPISQLKKNNIVIVKSGESIPQDGQIIKGQGQIDESMITGESLPVDKKENDTVIGGSILIDGLLEVLITTTPNTTILSNIINQTKASLTKKIPIEKLADKISKYFVYTVLTLSIITFIVWIVMSKNLELSINFALSVMVISCPCALGLATPSAIYVANSSAAINGILIKNPNILEIFHKTKYLILDKTGTLTENKLHIVKEEKYDDSFIDVICSLESRSNHPIAKTIVSNYKYTPIAFDSIEEIKGKGIKAIKNNSIYFIGNINYLKENNIIFKQNDEASSLIIGASKDGKLLGLIHLKDVIRKNTIPALNSLKEKNINLILCTGDNEKSALLLNEQFSFDEINFNIKPEQKNEIITSFKQKGITTMVGDGINDAIALSNANISISVNEASDIANASSDIVLINNDINDINYLYDLSKKTMRIIKQNLFWALFYNAIFIPLAAGLLYNKFGIMLTPIIGSITMSISSILVISNALRIKLLKRS